VGPAVSLLVVCKDSAQTIDRCIASLIDQDHAPVRIVVQDGGSRDGTLERLRAYGDRIDLVSEPDRDQNEGFLKGLRRCRGDVIGFCWADETLLPDACSFAVRELAARPEVAAVYGDFIETDAAGSGERVVSYPDWDFERVFTYEFIPPVCASFFRRTELEDSYLRIAHLAPGCTEYLLWVGVGSRHSIVHVGRPVARYARHAGQLSMSPTRMAHYAPQLAEAVERIAADPSMPEVVRRRRSRAIGNVHLWAAQWLHEACGAPEEGVGQLRSALRHDLDPAWLATAAWNCFRHSFARGEGELVLDWLHVLDECRVPIVGADYARALARLQGGDASGAAAAERGLVNEPYADALLRLVPDLVRALERGARGDDAERALALLLRLAERRSEVAFGLSLVLAELGRIDEALVCAARHAAARPGHEAGRLWQRQLQVLQCARDPATRRLLSSGDSELPVEEAGRIGDLVWRLVGDPDVARRASAAARPSLQRIVSAFRRSAEARGAGDLAPILRALETTLSSPPPAG
jgi:hypothetical protein